MRLLHNKVQQSIFVILLPKFLSKSGLFCTVALNPGVRNFMALYMNHKTAPVEMALKMENTEINLVFVGNTVDPSSSISPEYCEPVIYKRSSSSANPQILKLTLEGRGRVVCFPTYLYFNLTPVLPPYLKLRPSQYFWQNLPTSNTGSNKSLPGSTLSGTISP